MTKRIVAAILMCAVMALVALTPMVAGLDHTIVKGAKGPKESAVTWTYEPTEYGVWTAKMDNYGLRSLVLDVADNTTGAPEVIFHQRIRFAAYDAYPSGLVWSEPVNMAAGRLYEVTATPNGPAGTYVVVTDLFSSNQAPVASFTASTAYLTVSVDASASNDPDGSISEYIWEWGDGTMMGAGMTASHTYAMAGVYTVILTVVDNMGATGAAMQEVTVVDAPNMPPTAAFEATVTELVVDVDASGSSDSDGMIVSYAWNWGDGSPEEVLATPLASHAYAMAGLYMVTLTVTDDDGASDSAAMEVNPYIIVDNPPVAYFTVSVDGLTVSVDASGSSDDFGIVSYDWVWGDGTTGTGMTATHTYPASPPTALVIASRVSTDSTINAPLPPYYVAGYTYNEMGGIVPDCAVTVTDLRTMESIVAYSDASGFYMVDIANGLPGGMLVGDPISVTAMKGDMEGTTNAVLLSGGFTPVDVVLIAPQLPPYDVVITLTVTDAKGQTDTMSMTVTVYP